MRSNIVTVTNISQNHINHTAVAVVRRYCYHVISATHPQNTQLQMQIAEATGQTGQHDLVSHIRRQHMAVFGYVCRLPDKEPANATGSQHTSRMSSQQQPTVEASTWATETHLGPSSEDRHRNFCRCWIGHCRRPLQMDPSWSSMTDDDVATTTTNAAAVL